MVIDIPAFKIGTSLDQRANDARLVAPRTTAESRVIVNNGGVDVHAALDQRFSKTSSGPCSHAREN